MKNLIKNLLLMIKTSSKSPWGGLSTTRISSYLLLFVIILSIVVYLGIEISCAIIALKNTGAYIISSQSLIILGLILSHHITISGINKSHETKQLNNEVKKEPEPKENTEQL